MTIEQNAGEIPISNMRQQAADIMAQAFGGGESPQEPEHEPQQVEGENPEEPSLQVGEEVDSTGETEESGELEGEDGEIRTLKQLADAIEVEPEFLYGLSIPMSDGEDPVPLGEIKDRLQEAKRTESQRSRLEQERTAFQQEKEAWAQNVGQMQQQVLQMPREMQAAQAEMTALGQAWKYLEENKDQFEAGELALRKQEIQTAMGQAQGKVQTIQQNLAAQQREQQAQVMRENAVKLLEVVPEWRDQEKALASRAAINTVLSEYGFPENTVDGLYDYRLLHMLRDFSGMKKELDQAKAVLAKGTRAPKVLKPGAAPSRKTLSRKMLQEKLEAAKNTKNLRRKAAAVSELLGSM